MTPTDDTNKSGQQDDGTPKDDQGAGGTDTGQQPGDSTGGDGAGDGGGKPKEEPTITETALKARMARAKKKWEEEKAEEQRLAQLSAEERANAEKAAAEERANARVAQADERLIKAEARGIAAELGIREDRVAAALKFADLSDVVVDDDGEPDTAAIHAALSPILDQFPEWGKPDVGKAPGNTNTGADVPKGVDAEIQAAMDAGDYMKAEKLHAAKLANKGMLEHPK